VFRNLPLLVLALLLVACPAKKETVDTAQFQPSVPIPEDSALTHYENLHLGMSNLEISQVYNAPDGKGKGFRRGIEDYDDARNHIIEFDQAKGAPKRRIVLRVYQDKLALIVDRRDQLNAKQAADWFASLKKAYGQPTEQLPGAQWVWGKPGEVNLTYTQDNHSAENMSANVVLRHDPTYDASRRYLEYQQANKSSSENKAGGN
jgi:hypothetical protein